MQCKSSSTLQTTGSDFLHLWLQFVVHKVIFWFVQWLHCINCFYIYNYLYITALCYFSFPGDMVLCTQLTHFWICQKVLTETRTIFPKRPHRNIVCTTKNWRRVTSYGFHWNPVPWYWHSKTKTLYVKAIHGSSSRLSIYILCFIYGWTNVGI